MSELYNDPPSLLSSLLGWRTTPVKMGSGRGLSPDSIESNSFGSMAVPNLSDPPNTFSDGLGMKYSQSPYAFGDGWKGSGLGAATSMGQDRGIFSTFLQQKYADGSTGGGYGSAGLGILQGLGSAYMGMKQYGLAKDSLNESKKQFNMNYAAQQKLTNSEMEDRQNRRMRENPNAMPTPEYMKKNGI